MKSDAKARPIQGKTFILGVLGVLVLMVGIIFWIGMSGGSTHVPLSKPGVGFTADDAGPPPTSPATGTGQPATGSGDGASSRTPTPTTATVGSRTK